MSKFSYPIKSMQLRNDGSAALIVTGNDVHSANGVFVLKPAQVQRLAERSGAMHPIALKHLIDLSNGSAQYKGDKEFRKIGDVWVKADKTPGGTITKDHWATSNDEIELGMVAKLKLSEISVTRAMDLAMMNYGTPVRNTSAAPAVAEVVAETSEAEVETTTDVNQPVAKPNAETPTV